MALCPFALQKPVSAHGGPISQVLGVVLHVTAGTGDPFNEFANPANQVSSHFGVGNGRGGMPDGQIEQYVDTANESWAQAAGNSSYLSIETEGEPTTPLTAAQVAAVGKIMAWTNQVHRVPLTVTDTVGARGLITHGDGGAAWGGHTGCPGALRTAQRPAILAAAQAVLKPTGGAPVSSSDFPNAVASILTPTGNGAWVVGSDGGIFCTGDAQMYGSLPALKVTPAAPVVDAAGSWSGKGYYLLGRDGGVYCFGDAVMYGSYPALPATEREGTRSFGARGFNLHWAGTGYTLVALDGSRYGFGS